MENIVTNWDFSLANYSGVWYFLVEMGLLLLFLLIGNTLRNLVPLFRNCLIPSALIGGVLLLICNMVAKCFDVTLVDKHLMQVVTYHGLGLGFAAMTLKTVRKTDSPKGKVFEFGALQGGSYMLQAFVGLGATLILFFLSRKAIPYISGLLLPLAFGQGPGNALSWDINYTNTPETAFAGNGSFGLSLASIGFIVASIIGVVYINYLKRKGKITIRGLSSKRQAVDHTNPSGNEIPDSESVDKFTVQMGLVVLAYGIAFGIMCLLGVLSDFTNSVAWGFNFMWAAIGAIIVKLCARHLQKQKIMKREYINNYQMDRISGFFFDLMIVAGVAAIEIKDIKDYILPIVVLTVLGGVATFLYVKRVAKNNFSEYEHEFFLMCFGTLTGTASNGMILMKEIDPELETPIASLYVRSTFPAMVLVAPLLFLLGFAGASLKNALIACGIFFVLWVLYTLFIFRKKIFKKKK